MTVLLQAPTPVAASTSSLPGRMMALPVLHPDQISAALTGGTVESVLALITPGLAAGMLALIAAMEWHGHNSQEARWDDLARRLLAAALLITGLCTGLAAILWAAAPMPPGNSLRALDGLRDWQVSLAQIGLMLAYRLTWRPWQSGFKRAHIGLAITVALLSLAALAALPATVAPLFTGGSQSGPGSTDLPQLAFRISLALAFAAVASVLLIQFLADRRDNFRCRALRAVFPLALLAGPVLVWTGYWFYLTLPAPIPAAITLVQFDLWHAQLLKRMAATAFVMMVVAQVGVIRPQMVPRVVVVVPLLGLIWLGSHALQVRQFSHEPEFAPGIRLADAPLANGLPPQQP